MFEIPQNIIKLAKSVRVNGGRAMLVGGCVRDELLGIEPKDWDVEVYGIEPEKLKLIINDFGSINAVGEAFTVYKIGNEIDVSIPRRERKVSKGHKGFAVEGDPKMSFEEASKRRDFTINAVLKDVLTGELIDCFGGEDDIKKRILRVVSPETFAEDSLRVLRAAQFAARFNFDIDKDTIKLCQKIDLTDLPSERILGEFEKLLLKSAKPSVGLKWLYELGIVEQLFPELKALVGTPQEPEWHPEGDVDVHTMLVVDEARKLIDDLDYAKKVTVMLGALCHDFGKPVTTKFFDGRWRSHAHDTAGVEPTKSFLDTLNIHTLDGYNVRQQVIRLVIHHLKPSMFYKSRDEMGDGAFRRLAGKVELDLLYRVSKADCLGRNADWLPKEKHFKPLAQEWFRDKIQELDIKTDAPNPILLGRHLIEFGLEPSPKFGAILHEVFEQQLDGKIKNLNEAKDFAREIIEQ